MEHRVIRLQSRALQAKPRPGRWVRLLGLLATAQPDYQLQRLPDAW
jgi:hypothetical protein